jgi:hypothetical protein
MLFAICGERVLRPPALGDVDEHDAELHGRVSEREDLVVAAEHRRVVLELRRRAGERDPTVLLHPPRVVAGEHLAEALLAPAHRLLGAPPLGRVARDHRDVGDAAVRPVLRDALRLEVPDGPGGREVLLDLDPAPGPEDLVDALVPGARLLRRDARLLRYVPNSTVADQAWSTAAIPSNHWGTEVGPTPCTKKGGTAPARRRASGSRSRSSSAGPPHPATSHDRRRRDPTSGATLASARNAAAAWKQPPTMTPAS